MREIETKRPKIGVAFGGGGFKGAAHVGILKILEKNHIPIDYVSGTSVGSLIAAMVALDYSATKIENIILQMDLDRILAIHPRRMGFISGDEYADFAKACTKNKTFADTVIPLRIVAADLISWNKIVFDSGKLAHAIRASSAVPGVITPVKDGEMLLADGGLCDNCPVMLLREMGADIVIGISLNSIIPDEPKSLIDVIVRSMEMVSTRRENIGADILLEPIKTAMNFLDSKVISVCLAMGEKEAFDRIPQILNLIEQKTQELNQ